MQVINLTEKFSRFTEQWTPKIAGELNGQYLKLAKLKGEFLWHSHDDEDELFMVIKGTLILDFRDRTETIREGEIIIVPKGIEHRPRTGDEEVHVMLFEPKSTKHTGEVEHQRTVKELEWV
ncbi:MAG: mannose-6-phosphate isomerase [Saprospiraceae bacterium]|nr:MAG: mannose-6-phosphate isomerase [Saprospiraceae bacterium]